MKILIINCGSSSLKYQVIEMPEEKILARGIIDRIGLPGSLIHHLIFSSTKGTQELNTKLDVNNHREAIDLMVDTLVDSKYGVIKNLSEIEAIGHRVVHGGEEFSKAIVLNDQSIKRLEKFNYLAPLHNPANLLGIRAAKKKFPLTIQVGVFDTAFHHTIPPKAFLYALPYRFYEQYKIRRYGFHGTSHKYVAARVADILQKPLEELKIISLHLGNGASIAAIKNGMSVDTSMGFTPLEGLVMGTRSGNLDPAIVTFIMNKEKITSDQVNDLLNKQSGVLGLSGISSDFRDLEKAEAKGSKKAKMALDVFVYSVVKYIGSYYLIMEGVDALIFTAGIGENSSLIRACICSYLNLIGVSIDHVKNRINGKEIDISSESAACKVFVIPTNEELLIAKETISFIKSVTN